jgi:hypothetical protein
MGTMQQLIEARGRTAKKTWDEFEAQASYNFLVIVADLIRQAAGKHAEDVAVQKAGRGLYFVTYTGTDVSDMPLEWTGTLGVDKNEVIFHGEWDSKGKGKGKGQDVRMPKGTATPDHMADLFAGAFGR